jgi:hypothetical protein
MAALGELQTPSHDETVRLLVEVLTQALRQIPTTGGAWSWGEFHNGGIQPLFDISRDKEWYRLAVCAIDLGVADRQPVLRSGEILNPLEGLARNLGDAVEAVLHQVRLRLEQGGIAP